MNFLAAVSGPDSARDFLVQVAAQLPQPAGLTIVEDADALRVALHPGARFDAVIIDLTLEGIEPIDGIADLRMRHPQFRYVAVTSITDPHVEVEVARAGALACIKTTDTVQHAARVLDLVGKGASYLSTSALLAVGDEITRMSHAILIGSIAQGGEALTHREARILAHIRNGVSNRAIADAIGLDENRVKIHVRTIFRKIGCRNRTQAALAAEEFVSQGTNISTRVAEPLRA
jgi:DNA-binding NarL/FixJ family response regulator